MKIPGISKLVREHFFSGMFLVIPIYVIFLIVSAIIGFFFNLTQVIPDSLWGPVTPSQQWMLDAGLTIAAALALVVGVSFLGWVSKFYIGKRVFEWLGEVIQKVPVLGSIYSSLDQLLRTMGEGSNKQFSRVVYLEYPRSGSWAIGFVTGAAKTKMLPEGHLNVFVPTVPNPTSGFHLIVPEKDVKESGLSVEEAFKTILSLGIAQGSNK